MAQKSMNALNNPSSPNELSHLQNWFGGVIAQPLGRNNKIQSRAPSGALIEEEAAQYVVSTRSLKAHQRMQIYNQQYWWRLLNNLHITFPLTVRLFGYHAFNEQIGIPYLLRFPPNHWSLNALGEQLAFWIKENYQERDQTLIYNAVALDWGFTSSFISPNTPPFRHQQGSSEEDVLSTIFYLQPHIHLFQWEYDLFSFRKEFLEKEVEYWLRHPFPQLNKGRTYRFVLYRTFKNYIGWREISEGEFLLLEKFKQGATLPEACDEIEKQRESLYEIVASNLQSWLYNWTQAGWLSSSTF